MGWDHLVISGDLTQLALPEEFAKARMALQPLLQDQERVSIVPGNHDYYVSETEESDYFFSYFGSFFGKNEIHTRQLNQDWHLIGWHSATPTPWYSASGCVWRQTLKATDEYLQQQSADTRFVLVNHYPISFPDREHDTKHELLNLEQVQYWRSFTEPLMYLGMNNTGEFPVVPNQMSWWMKGNPFDVWADPINGPVTSESHTCFGLMQTWQAVCSAGPWYRRPLYDPRGTSGPEADEDNSCGRLMEQYTRMCHRPANSMHEMSAIA